MNKQAATYTSRDRFKAFTNEPGPRDKQAFFGTPVGAKMAGQIILNNAKPQKAANTHALQSKGSV